LIETQERERGSHISNYTFISEGWSTGSCVSHPAMYVSLPVCVGGGGGAKGRMALNSPWQMASIREEEKWISKFRD